MAKRTYKETLPSGVTITRVRKAVSPKKEAIKQRNMHRNQSKKAVTKLPSKKLLLVLPDNIAYHAAAMGAYLKLKSVALLDLAVSKDPYGIWKTMGIPTDIDYSASPLANFAKNDRVRVAVPEINTEGFTQLETWIKNSKEAQLQKGLMNEDKKIVATAPTLNVCSAVHLLLWKDIMGSSPSYDIFKDGMPFWPVKKLKQKLPNTYFVTYGTLPASLETALEIYSDRRITPSTLDELISVSTNSRCTQVFLDVDDPAIAALMGSSVVPIPVTAEGQEYRYVPSGKELYLFQIGEASGADVGTVLENLL